MLVCLASGALMGMGWAADTGRGEHKEDLASVSSYKAVGSRHHLEYSLMEGPGTALPASR